MHLHDGVERTCKENILKRQSLITKKPKSTGTSLPLSWCQVKTNWTCFKLASIYKRADTRLWNRTTSSQRKSNLYLHLFIKGKREIFLLIGTHRWAYKVCAKTNMNSTPQYSLMNLISPAKCFQRHNIFLLIWNRVDSFSIRPISIYFWMA